ncbi:MAG: hypothetical protein AB1556_12440 [Bacillota bacterium]
METISPDGGKVVVEFKELHVGPQPEELFRLPEGVKVIDIGEMMEKGMPFGGLRSQAIKELFGTDRSYPSTDRSHPKNNC